jgi:hypothetical protein
MCGRKWQHFSTFTGEFFGHRPAQAFAGSRNDSDAAVEP